MSQHSKIRVLLVDDHNLVRHGIRVLLEGANANIEVVGESADGADILRLIAELRPDVVVLDLSLSSGSGLDVVAIAKQAQENVKFVILTMHASSEFVARARHAGCDAYVVKGADVAELVEAIHAVRQGRVYLSKAVSALLEDPSSDPLERLSARERQVLCLIAEGHTSKGIAAQLGISAHTVNAHRVNLMDKLDLHDAQSLTRFALRHGLISN